MGGLGLGVFNERPGNRSCDLRADERPKKKRIGNGQTHRRTDMATLGLTRTRGQNKCKLCFVILQVHIFNRPGVAGALHKHLLYSLIQ